MGLLAGAGLLVLVTVAFLGYGRFRAKQFLTELPKKLGADIRQETSAFTYSQTVKGRTVFTVHAAKAVQHSDGKYTLHDVGIVMYGRGSEPNRVDRIYGSEFEYDQNAGVIRAMGEVHLDLQAPAATNAEAKMDYAEGKDLKSGKEVGSGAADSGEKDDRLIHVKTSGLVFMRELGVAATDQDIEFEFGGWTGHAHGAEYNSDSGVLVLQSAVKANGLERGNPVVLTATRAEMDRLNRVAILTQAKYVAVGGSAHQSGEAQHAVVHTRPDGAVERLEAQGSVTVNDGNGGRTVADRADVWMSPQSRPQSVRMFGGVRYVNESPERQAQGEAQDAHGVFDSRGRLEHVSLNRSVVLHERENLAQQTSGAKPRWSERQLNAEAVELAFLADDSGNPKLQDAKASGGARLNVVDPGRQDTKQGQGWTNSTMVADLLTAHFVKSGGAQRLNEVHGEGHTSLKQVNEAGVEETSLGDSLEAKFKASHAQGGTADRKGTATVTRAQGEQIATAVQQGNVVMTRRPAPKPGVAVDVQRATAQRAVYDGESEKTTLSGGVELSDTSGVLWADHVTMDRTSGDSAAEGGVKASYRQSAQSEVVHVLAQRAELKRASDQTLFYGVAGKPARLWQGGSQVEAPVLEFRQKERSLIARGFGQAMSVHTVLVGGSLSGGEKKAAPDSGVRSPRVVRVGSREMVYLDAKREANFTGGVLVESADGTMRGQQATAFLQPATTEKAGEKKASSTATQAAFLGGSVERVVVTGDIRMEQPGRSATGEQLVYTADDGMFVLTGTPGSPPKVVDETRGTVTGAELRFRTGDESIVISNGANKGEGPRVHTETRVKR